MRIIRFLILAGGFGLCPFTANAATVDIAVVGVNYSISTIYGTYPKDNSVKAALESTPWWGNESLAKTISSVAGFEFTGTDPLFAYKAIDMGVYTRILGYNTGFDNGATSFHSARFAVGSVKKTGPATAGDVPPVPLPAAAPMLIAGLGALGFVARRRKKAA